MAVPVLNIYYLLCYAWQSNLGDLLPVDAISGDRPEDLFALLLAEGLQPLLPHRLERGYRAEEDDLRGPRGKINLASTLSRALRPRGRVACSFDEVSVDIPSNRVLKGTIRRLLGVDTLDARLRGRLVGCLRALAAVTDVPVCSSDASRVILHGNNARYALLMRVCGLVLDHLLPAEGDGNWKMRPFFGDESAMGGLFEDFLYNFLRREQTEFKVGRSQPKWRCDPQVSEDVGWLPGMETDIELTRPGRRVVIEAKFYSEPLQTHYGRSSVRSAHLYQVMAYLHALRVDLGEQPEGMLLYAGVGAPIDLCFRIDGHNVRVRSLNLNQPWKGVRDELLGVVTLLSAGYSASVPA